MRIFLIFLIIILIIYLIFKFFFHSAKRNLFKDHAAWSGKDIKIKYNTSKGISESNKNENYLKMIADESKIYLEDQYLKKNNETK